MNSEGEKKSAVPRRIPFRAIPAGSVAAGDCRLAASEATALQVETWNRFPQPMETAGFSMWPWRPWVMAPMVPCLRVVIHIHQSHLFWCSLYRVPSFWPVFDMDWSRENTGTSPAEKMVNLMGFHLRIRNMRRSHGGSAGDRSGNETASYGHLLSRQKWHKNWRILPANSVCVCIL